MSEMVSRVSTGPRTEVTITSRPLGVSPRNQVVTGKRPTTGTDGQPKRDGPLPPLLPSTGCKGEGNFRIQTKSRTSGHFGHVTIREGRWRRVSRVTGHRV